MSAPPATLGEDASYTIAYASFSPLNAEIFLADPDGVNPEPFLPAPGQDINASFSADGEWVIFTSERRGSLDIYRARVDGTGLEQLTDWEGYDDQAALSPDGSTLAFVSTRGGGRTEIYTLDIASGEVTNLTNQQGGDFRPAWSPDGEWIAFSSDRDVDLPTRPGSFEHEQLTELYLMRPDGSELRQLTDLGANAGSPSWSADGSSIFFYTASLDDVILISDPRRLRATTQIARVDVASGEVTVLTEGPGEKWSPHPVAGDRVAYFSGGPGGGLEFVNGSAGTRGEFNSPDFAPDGSRMIYFRDMGQNWPPVMSTYSRDADIALLRTGIFPSFSPEGDRLVFTTGTAALSHNGLMEASRDGSNRWLIHDDLEHNTVSPMWSPGGDLIAFGSGGAFQGAVGVGRQVSNIAVISPDGTGFQLLTNDDGNHNFASWSPDGSEIVYRSQDADSKGLRILDVATGAVRVLTDTDFNDNFPAWSPDGEEILFTSDREDSDFEIYSIRPDGSGLRRVTNIPGNDAHSQWSPDGEWIAFATGRDYFKDEMALHPHNPQSYGEVAVIRPDGSDFHILTDNPWEDATPRWDPVVR